MGQPDQKRRRAQRSISSGSGVGASRVLIVEPDPVIQTLLKELLIDPSRATVAVGSFAEGLTAAKKHPPDVVLVEKSLGGDSGLALTRKLIKLDRRTEIIVMSAMPTPDSVIEAVEAGASDYLAKPFEDIEEVAVRVNNAEDRATLRNERARLHQRLQESEERYRKLFEASPDAVLVVDEASGEVQDANGAALELYGYDRSSFVGRSVDDLHAPDDGQEPDPAGWRVRQRTDVDRHGDPIAVEVTTSRFQVGERQLVVEVVRDIRERLAAEVAQRELEAQLQQAQKMEALGLLAGGVAHDFNNLLAAILNYGELVALELEAVGGDLDEIREDVEQIQQAALSAASVTRQLLAFSRREIVSPEVVSLNGAVRALEKMLRRTLGEDLKLEIRLDAKLPAVEIDRGQLEQVVINLAVNARDAMPDGGTLTIETAVAAPSAGTRAVAALPAAVELRVADTGSGMAPEVAARIFEPFFTTKVEGKGTGLGLATVRGIVESAGGTIAVDSSLGKGTVFTVTLPATTKDRRHTSDRPDEEQMPRARAGESVLVVEDDDAVRRATLRFLVRAGYRVAEARTGEEALDEHGKRKRFDLLLADVVMPGMSGGELAERLQERQPDLKVIYMTGYATQAKLDRLGAEGDRALLPKPFREQRLLALVRTVLDTENYRPPVSIAPPKLGRSF